MEEIDFFSDHDHDHDHDHNNEKIVDLNST
jgi:hypothetical protein